MGRLFRGKEIGRNARIHRIKFDYQSQTASNSLHLFNNFRKKR